MIKGILLFIVVIAIIGSCAKGDSDSTSSLTNPSQTEITQNYQKAINEANAGRWDKVTVDLVYQKDKDEKSKTLYYYAYAKEEYNKGDISQAIYALQQIPDTFTGDFADDIKKMKEEVYPQKEAYEEQKKQKEQEKKEYRDNHLYVGDPEEKITQVKGEPYEVNRTVIGNHVNKQYVYYNEDTGKMVCIYTEDGIVTSWQD